MNFLRKKFSERKKFLVSQGISAINNYLPVFFSLLTREPQLIGTIVILQSLLTIYIAIVRSGFGNAYMKESRSDIKIENSRLVFVMLTTSSFLSAYLFLRLAHTLSFSHYVLVFFIIVFNIFHEFDRARLISSGDYATLVKSDLVFLISSCFISLFYFANLSVNSILFFCFVGPFCSLIYLRAIHKSGGFFNNLDKGKEEINSHLIALLFLPIISFTTVFILNMTWAARFDLDDVGIVRGIAFFFVPLQFFVNAFPHFILKEKISPKKILNLNNQFLIIFFCAFLSLVWIVKSEMLTTQSLLIVVLLSASIFSVIHSQETALFMIQRNRVSRVLQLRLLWAFIVIISALFMPQSDNSAIVLALLIAFSDVFYAILLQLNFRYSRKGKNAD